MSSATSPPARARSHRPSRRSWQLPPLLPATRIFVALSTALGHTFTPLGNVYAQPRGGVTSTTPPQAFASGLT